MGLLNEEELWAEVDGDKLNDGRQSIIDEIRKNDLKEFPAAMTDADVWANYVNMDLYEMDVLVREWLAKTRWKREYRGGMRTTASLVFTEIFGHKPTGHDTGKCRILTKLLKYYAVRYNGPTTYQGKKVSMVYEFSKYGGVKRRPYSLKLRLEQIQDEDRIKHAFRRTNRPTEDLRGTGRRLARKDDVF